MDTSKELIEVEIVGVDPISVSADSYAVFLKTVSGTPRFVPFLTTFDGLNRWKVVSIAHLDPSRPGSHLYMLQHIEGEVSLESGLRLIEAPELS